MFRVYFEDKWYKRTLLAECATKEEACKEFSEYLKSKNVKAPYYRSWTTEKNETIIDFGSHSEFGIVSKV